MSGEVVIIAGPPASGKTTQVQDFVERGYTRINRDLLDKPGHVARTDDCALHLAQLFDSGQATRFVLDNTYGTKKQRALLLEVARERGLPVHIRVMSTTREQCQFLAARRMIQKYGKMMTAAEMKAYKAENGPDPNLFPPVVISVFFKKREQPEPEEGFASIEYIPFVFELGPEYTNSAYIFDYDGTLRDTKNDEKYPVDQDNIEIRPGVIGVLNQLEAQGHLLLGISTQSGVTKGVMTWEECQGLFEYTNAMLGHDIETVFCPHRAGPPQCYCRKPMPGWGVWFIEKYKLDPAKVVYVGDMTSDKTFSGRAGFKFVHADQFFA